MNNPDADSEMHKETFKSKPVCQYINNKEQFYGVCNCLSPVYLVLILLP